ncbi:hypothetical protein O3M35_002002 [Rhynocoris fuscipes]|uniref:Uncharacterized protein n=1 Tax=Rhynocoris fuscipes TaxID=488301 RepID=A0AAW1CS13_9HEMI
MENVEGNLLNLERRDSNVLDLGFFNCIQSLQHEASPHTIDELINCVQDAFHQLEANTLDNVSTTLQACMESIMLADGGNCYKIPHLSKGKLRCEGRLLEKCEWMEDNCNWV